MLALERQQRILSLLLTKKSVKVSELSKLFNVSPETIRNDLRKFEKEGIIIKAYGGAILKEGFYKNKQKEENKNFEMPSHEAERLAYAISKEIEDGSTVVLDNSHISLLVAKYLKQLEKKITIITNYEKIVIELADTKDIDLICTGGSFDKKSYSYVGCYAEGFVRSLHADVAVITCEGFDLKRGITESDELIASMKKSMAAISNEIFLAVKESNIENTGIIKFLEIDDITSLFVSTSLPEDIEKYLVAKRIRVKYC